MANTGKRTTGNFVALFLFFMMAVSGVEDFGYRYRYDWDGEAERLTREGNEWEWNIAAWGQVWG
jgi:hypothetical protein